MYHRTMTTMREISLAILSTAFTLTGFGQTLFFDNLEATNWLSVSSFSDSLLQNSKEIPLGKLMISKDSLREGVNIWNFKEGVLTISFFDIHEKKETPISTFQYQANRDKGILTIKINNEELDFEIGITSTGNNALLIGKKEKLKKKKEKVLARAEGAGSITVDTQVSQSKHLSLRTACLLTM